MTAEASDFWSAQTALNQSTQEGEEDVYRPWVFALGYTLLPEGSERRDRAGGHFGAMVAVDDWRFPPALDDLPEGLVEAWQEGLAELKDDPMWAARLGDLLWTVRIGDRYPAALVAIDGYITLSGQARINWMARTHCAIRAHEMALELRDGQRELNVVESIHGLIDADLSSDEGGPGITMNLIKSLMRASQSDATGILKLLDCAESIYGNDPHIAENIDDFRAQLLSGEAEVEARRSQVNRWREYAKRAEGFLRAHWLERALDLARRHGLKNEADELRVELGELTHDDLDLKQISATIEIPRKDVEEAIASIVGDDNLDSALKRLGSYPPPGQSPAQLQAEAVQQMQQFPVQFLFTQTVIGPGSAVAIFHADDDTKKLRLVMGRLRQQAGALWGIFVADALLAIADKYGPFEPEQLTKLFETEIIDAEIAERIAYAFRLFYEREADGAAHVLLPRIEAIVRQLVRMLGVPIVHEPVPGKEFGSVSTLGTLLSDLQGAFADEESEAWRAYLRDLLVNPLSLNLRNDVLHGLTGHVSMPECALLLHVICWMRLLRPVGRGEVPEGAE